MKNKLFVMMNYKSIFLVFFLNLFFSCSSKNWKSNKTKAQIYPLDEIHFTKSNRFGDIIGTEMIWVNNALKNYPYKEFCANKLVMTFDLNDSATQSIFKQDSIGIAYYVVKRFRENGVSHFAFQSINNDFLKLCLYNEQGLNQIAVLKSLDIPNEAEMISDSKWKAYYDCLNSE